jgi:putative ABC transport system permease protein
METLLQDLRYGIRLLLRRPIFTVVAIVVLALGIGANTAIFSMVNAVLLRSLPYDEPDRLVWLWNINRASNVEKEPLSFPNYTDWRNQNQSFEEMAAFTRWLPVLTNNDEPERIVACQASASFFPVLRAGAALGRTFTAEEDQPGKNQVAVISHGLWKRHYGSDKEIVGKAITLNGVIHTVVGVMPEGFQHPTPDERKPPELWAPLGLDANKTHRRGDFLGVIARLEPSVSIDEARAEMDTIAARLDEQYPDANAGWRVTIIPLHERFTGDVRPAMLLLLGAVTFLLLIACANVANLLLVRSTARQKEIAIRRALGAARGRLVRQFLTESVVLAIAGGTLGTLLAMWGVNILVAFSPDNIPRVDQAGVDLRVLGFTLAISLLTGIIFGLVPALQSSNPDLNESLKEGGRGPADGAGGRRVRSLLMVFEIAMALVLLIGAGLMVKSFLRLQRVAPGFEPQRLLTTSFVLPRTKYKGGRDMLTFYQQLIERVESLPSVEATALVSSVPLSGAVAVFNIEVVGMAPLPAGHIIGAQSQVVSPSYFRAMGIPLLKGRLFTEQDAENTPGVIVINDVMAERYWPGEDPIGKRISLISAQTGPWLTVIGVVGDVRQLALNSPPYPQMYQVYTQNTPARLSLVVRTTSDPMSLVPSIRSQVFSLDRDQPLYNLQTMDQLLSYSVSGPRFNMLLISIFTGVALALAAVGVYGVVSYSVSNRAHEIGIRMAVGAQQRHILQMVIGQGFKLVLFGLVIGIVAALLLTFVLTRILSSVLYNVSSTDPLTFISVSVMLAVVALAACYIPARRAAKLDPVAVLRHE